MVIQELREEIANINPEAILWDNLDECIVGISVDGRVLYDTHRLLYYFTTVEELSEEDALEHINYNIIGSYVGEFTPLHVILNLHNNLSFGG